MATSDLTSNSLLMKTFLLLVNFFGQEWNSDVKIYLFLVIILFMKYGLLWLRSNDMILLRFAIMGILLLTVIHVYLSLSLLDPHSKIFFSKWSFYFAFSHHDNNPQYNNSNSGGQ